MTDLLGDSTNNNVGRGLVWLKNANCTATLASIAKTGTLTWDNAQIWSSALLTGSCSLSDGSTAFEWRLPTRAELDGITNGMDPVLSDTPRVFSGVQSSNYWSSTTYSSFTTLAWYVSLGNGYVYNANKTSSIYVWPVRGGQ